MNTPATPLWVQGNIKRILGGFFLFIMLAMPVFATNNIYAEVSKTTNGTYTWYLPKLELASQRFAGNLFGTPVNYLSEMEGGLLFTAPRSNAMQLNHYSIDALYNFGVEVGPFWTTFSVGMRNVIAGNNEGVSAGCELLNLLRVGMTWD